MAIKLQSKKDNSFVAAATQVVVTKKEKKYTPKPIIINEWLEGKIKEIKEKQGVSMNLAARRAVKHAMDNNMELPVLDDLDGIGKLRNVLLLPEQGDFVNEIADKSGEKIRFIMTYILEAYLKQ